MVAGRETVRTGQKIAVERPRCVGMDEFGRNPARFPLQQIEPLRPRDPGVGVEFSAGRAQAERIDHGAVRRKLSIRGETALRNFLGVETFDSLHQRRSHRLSEIQTLALRDRNRTRIGAHGDDDRDADMVETGDVAEPRNPHPRHIGAKPGQRFRRRIDTVGAVSKRLWQRRFEDRSGSGWRQPFLSVGVMWSRGPVSCLGELRGVVTCGGF